MARDAIKCHLQGLLKDGEPIPDDALGLNVFASTVLQPKEVLRALLKAGFEIYHQTGNHAQLRHAEKPHLRVTVPRHDRFDLPAPVLKNILRQAEITQEESLEYL